jgi:RNA polymerase sigma-70 factor, ECF subfamily
MHAMAAAMPQQPDAPSGTLDDLTLRRAQVGEHGAWRVLVGQFERPVHALIWRLLAGRAQHRAPDLTQETFVRVLRALPRFDPDGPAKLSTWILTIATRLALNELRRPEPGPLVSEPISTTRVDHDLERKQLGEAIAAGIAALPDAQRAVLVLREYHELDYAEIADALELDVGTVKSRLSRARAALRAHLTELGVGR